MVQPILYLTFGHPGSGKTYFSSRLARDLGLFHLNGDRLRQELFEQPSYTLQETKSVFRVMDYVAEELLKRGMSVIYDGNMNKREFRDRVASVAKRAGAQYRLVWVKTPVALSTVRLRDRHAQAPIAEKKYYTDPPADVVRRIIEESEEPAQDREPHIVIDGALDYDRQKSAILEV